MTREVNKQIMEKKVSAKNIDNKKKCYKINGIDIKISVKLIKRKG
jgi:hypothetical protein